jgi:hypothetical protein
VWAESANRQQGSGRRAAFAWQPCTLARPGARIAYLDEPAGEREWSPLAERVRAAFDPEGILR